MIEGFKQFLSAEFPKTAISFGGGALGSYLITRLCTKIATSAPAYGTVAAVGITVTLVAKGILKYTNADPKAPGLNYLIGLAAAFTAQNKWGAGAALGWQQIVGITVATYLFAVIFDNLKKEIVKEEPKL